MAVTYEMQGMNNLATSVEVKAAAAAAKKPAR